MIGDLIGKIIAGRFRIDSLIRETEVGDFYRGTNLGTGAPVTIKTLARAMAIDQRYVDRFLRDENAAAAVTHPNILNNLEIGLDDHGTPHSVYEGTDGGLLSAMLKENGKLPVADAISIAKQAASALSAAHSAGLVHGGLNPDKLFIDNEAGVFTKVFDFGARTHARNSMSAAGYLSPEQCSAPPTFDERSDIYSLGVMLYEMLAGERPYVGGTPAETIAKQGTEPPPPLSAFRHDLHPQIEPVILSSMSRNPDLRYQTMADLEEDLARIGTEIGVDIPAVAVAQTAAATAAVSRNKWQTVAIAITGVVILASALIYVTTVRQTNPTASLAPDANSLPVQPINPATGAQEDALTKLGDLGDASLVPNSSMELPGTIPGGDGFNAWANGGMPPAGAPLSGSVVPGPPIGGPQPPQYIPPGGQTVTVDPNGGSVFMPNEGGVILVPIPQTEETPPKATPTPKAPAANTSVKPTATPNPSATPASQPAGPATETAKPKADPAKSKKAAATVKKPTEE